MHRIYKILQFYLIKLPFIYLAIPIGFIFEFLITFPYIVLCELDRRSERRVTRK